MAPQIIIKSVQSTLKIATTGLIGLPVPEPFTPTASPWVVNGSICTTGHYQMAELATPPSGVLTGFARMYAKADGRLYFLDSTGAETDLLAHLSGVPEPFTPNTSPWIVNGAIRTTEHLQAAELATPPSGVLSGFGRFYVKASDGEPYFRDSSGVESSLLGGGGGVPGGANTQVQFNSAGVFGGIPSVTWDGSRFYPAGAGVQSTLAGGGAAQANGTFATSYGYGAGATGTETMASGHGSAATALRASAYGRATVASHSGSVALGAFAATTAAGRCNIGTIGSGTNDLDLQIGKGLGIFGATPPSSKPTVTGSRGGNAALASLLTTLAVAGHFTDSTSA